MMAGVASIDLIIACVKDVEFVHVGVIFLVTEFIVDIVVGEDDVSSCREGRRSRGGCDGREVVLCFVVFDLVVREAVWDHAACLLWKAVEVDAYVARLLDRF